MNAYFEFLLVFLLLFALVFVLAYLPGVFVAKKWGKQNLIFLVSFGLMYPLEVIYGNGNTKTSFAWSIGFIYLSFNIYLLLCDKIKLWGKLLNAIIDFVLCSLTLFASSCIVAFVDNLPIKDVILEKFQDGSYSFTPGYLYEIISNSAVFSLIIINFKYIHQHLLNKWEKRQKEKVSALKLQKKNIEIQFEILQAKVNPHFLYNSLNSIAGLATVDSEKTRQMALALSRFFRYSMNREQEMMITVEQETEIIKTYLEIEKIRFGDKLDYNIEILNNTKSCKIPKMLLLPIVENCMKHGMTGNPEALKVDISCSRSDTTLTISIKDNGTPFPKDIIPGYGIQSVYDKLDLLFPGEYNVELETHSEKDFRIHLNQST